MVNVYQRVTLHKINPVQSSWGYPSKSNHPTRAASFRLVNYNWLVLTGTYGSDFYLYEIIVYHY